MKRTIRLPVLAVLCIAAGSMWGQNLEKPAPKPNPPMPYNAKVDPEIPPYKPLKGISGTLKGVESNTVVDIMNAWITGFEKIYPRAHITVDIGGSGQIGPRLTAETVDFGFNARENIGREDTPFVDKFGYPPLGISVTGGSYAVKAFTDCIVFIVNKENPLNELTFQQLDAMYSLTRNRGMRAPITTWGQLGLTGEWADKPIHRWGVQIPNGYDNFVDIHVLAGGQWRGDISTDRVVIPLSDKVGADKYAISYTGLAWVSNPNVKVLKLAKNPGGPYIAPTFQTVASQTYPLSRVTYIFVNRKPGTQMSPLLREFIRYALSREGQQAVVNDGIFTPLPAALDAQQAAELK